MSVNLPKKFTNFLTNF